MTRAAVSEELPRGLSCRNAFACDTDSQRIAMIHGYDKTTGHPALADKKVLLIDRCQATREVRAAVLRTHGVEVRVTAYGLMG